MFVQAAAAEPPSLISVQAAPAARPGEAPSVSRRTGAAASAGVPADVEASWAGATSGPVLSLGLGNSYGVLGLQAGYLFTGVPWLRQIGPYACLGYVPPLAPHTSSGADYCAGVLGYLGLRHRLVVDLGYQSLGYAQHSLHGTVVAVESIYGPALQAGYEFMASFGLLARVTLGGGLGVYSGEWLSRATPFLAGNLGVGWKL